MVLVSITAANVLRLALVRESHKLEAQETEAEWEAWAEILIAFKGLYISYRLSSSLEIFLLSIYYDLRDTRGTGHAIRIMWPE